MKYKVGDKVYSESTTGVYVIESISGDEVTVREYLYLSTGIKGSTTIKLYSGYITTCMKPAEPYLATYKFDKDLEELLNDF